jgi:hypothetical protein
VFGVAYLILMLLRAALVAGELVMRAVLREWSIDSCNSTTLVVTCSTASILNAVCLVIHESGKAHLALAVGRSQGLAWLSVCICVHLWFSFLIANQP